MGINGVAKNGLSHVMGLKTNFGLRKPFSHFRFERERESYGLWRKEIGYFSLSNQEFKRSRGRRMLGIEESKEKVWKPNPNFSFLVLG